MWTVPLFHPAVQQLWGGAGTVTCGGGSCRHDLFIRHVCVLGAVWPSDVMLEWKSSSEKEAGCQETATVFVWR